MLNLYVCLLIGILYRISEICGETLSTVQYLCLVIRILFTPTSTRQIAYGYWFLPVQDRILLLTSTCTGQNASGYFIPVQDRILLVTSTCTRQDASGYFYLYRIDYYWLLLPIQDRMLLGSYTCTR
jgi:hypothetical protein